MKLRLPSLRVAAVASSLLLAGGYVWFAHLGRIEQQRPKIFAGSKLRTLSIAGSRYSNPPPMTVKPVALGPFLNERAEPIGPRVSVRFFPPRLWVDVMVPAHPSPTSQPATRPAATAARD